MNKTTLQDSQEEEIIVTDSEASEDEPKEEAELDEYQEIPSEEFRLAETYRYYGD